MFRTQTVMNRYFSFVVFPVYVPDMVERESFRNIYTAVQLQLGIQLLCPRIKPCFTENPQNPKNHNKEIKKAQKCCIHNVAKHLTVLINENSICNMCL